VLQEGGEQASVSVEGRMEILFGFLFVLEPTPPRSDGDSGLGRNGITTAMLKNKLAAR